MKTRLFEFSEIKNVRLAAGNWIVRLSICRHGVSRYQATIIGLTDRANQSLSDKRLWLDS